MSDEKKDYVDLVFREGGRLRMSGSIVERFGLELEGELAEKLEQAEMQLEEMVAQRDAAEVRLAREKLSHDALRTSLHILDNQVEELKVDLRLRDEKYEARCEEMEKAYEEAQVGYLKELAINRATIERQARSIESQMLILQRLRAALKEADQEVSHAPLT